MKTQKKEIRSDVRPEYEFNYSKAVRGKYCKKILTEGANVVVLEPDIARVFVDSTSVNDALRSLLDLTKKTRHLTKPTKRGTLTPR